MTPTHLEGLEQAANLENHQPDQKEGEGSFVRGLSQALAAPALVFLAIISGYGPSGPGLALLAMFLWMLATPVLLMVLFYMGFWSKRLRARITSDGNRNY